MCKKIFEAKKNKDEKKRKIKERVDRTGSKNETKEMTHNRRNKNPITKQKQIEETDKKKISCFKSDA